MAVGLPLKTTYANGDVYSASDVNDTNGTINAYVSTGKAAGVNQFLNANFGIWQRGTSLSLSAGNNYLADRWNLYLNAATVTCSRQTFTPATAPVSGYEGTYFLRWAQTSGGASTNQFQQRLEDVRLFAGQACTFSFWAKADSSMDVSLRWEQNFGSGGSADVKTTGSSVTLTTSWVRYSFTFTPTSVSGKTIGTNSYFSVGLLFNSAQTKTMDIWGCQLEQGSTATAFQTATGTIQGELAACQRYYWRWGGQNNYQWLGAGSSGGGTTTANINVQFPVTMRTTPSSIDYSTLALIDATNVYAVSAASMNSGQNSVIQAALNVTTSGLTTYRFYSLLTNNSTSAYLGFNAEL
jgi:hypothetical protein